MLSISAICCPKYHPKSCPSYFIIFLQSPKNKNNIREKKKAHIKVVLKLMFEEEFNLSMGLCCVETNLRKNKFIFIH